MKTNAGGFCNWDWYILKVTFMCTIKVTFFVSLCFNLNIKYKINYSYSYGMFWSRPLSTTVHNIDISSRSPNTPSSHSTLSDFTRFIHCIDSKQQVTVWELMAKRVVSGSSKMLPIVWAPPLSVSISILVMVLPLMRGFLNGSSVSLLRRWG